MKLFYQEAIISGEFIAAISSFIAYVYAGKQVTLFKKNDVFYSQNLRREKICRLPLQRSTSKSAKYFRCKRSSQQGVCTDVCQCTILYENTDFVEVRGLDSDTEDD